MNVQRGGFILVAALWLLVALGAVGLDAALRSQTRRVPATRLIDQTRARQAALAGADYARSRLTAAQRARELEMRQQLEQRGIRAARVSITTNYANNPWREPEQLVDPSKAIGDLQFALQLRDGGAALNLNLATERMLQQFFAQGMQIDYPTADRLTQAILDWRDEDDITRLNGGEREDYIAAGAAVLPTNRRFASVDELRYVMGMTAELLEQMRPFVTVIGTGRINVNAAPVQVLSALPAFTPAHWAQLVRMRDAGRFVTSSAELRRLFGAANNTPQAQVQEFDRRVTYTTNEVVIVSEGGVTNSPVQARATVVVVQSPNGAAVTWQKVE